MAGSPLQARIKADLLKIVAAVPAGRVVSFDDIGAHLDLPPRQVAYILAMLPDEAKEDIPWHRAVGADGTLALPRAGADDAPQRARLAAEGATFDAEGALADMASRRAEVAGLPHGVPARKRAAGHPTPRRMRGSETSAVRWPAGRHR